ncbi:hypothetical protein D3C87_1128740 [compost metagenome]
MVAAQEDPEGDGDRLGVPARELHEGLAGIAVELEDAHGLPVGGGRRPEAVVGGAQERVMGNGAREVERVAIAQGGHELAEPGERVVLAGQLAVGMHPPGVPAVGERDARAVDGDRLPGPGGFLAGRREIRLEALEDLAEDGVASGKPHAQQAPGQAAAALGLGELV